MVEISLERLQADRHLQKSYHQTRKASRYQTGHVGRPNSDGSRRREAGNGVQNRVGPRCRSDAAQLVYAAEHDWQMKCSLVLMIRNTEDSGLHLSLGRDT